MIAVDNLHVTADAGKEQSQRTRDEIKRLQLTVHDSTDSP